VSLDHCSLNNLIAPSDMTIQASPFQRRLSPDEELAIIKQRADYLRSHPDDLKALLVKMGIHTKTGKLTKAYGG
jgi:hypothetical protein